MTCIGNSGPLPESVVTAIDQADLVAVGVLSGNRNFEGRINPHTRANYLASPPLCIAYAIAGTVLIDFEKEPLGKNIVYVACTCRVYMTLENNLGWPHDLDCSAYTTTIT